MKRNLKTGKISSHFWNSKTCRPIRSARLPEDCQSRLLSNEILIIQLAQIGMQRLTSMSLRSNFTFSGKFTLNRKMHSNSYEATNSNCNKLCNHRMFSEIKQLCNIRFAAKFQCELLISYRFNDFFCSIINPLQSKLNIFIIF